MKTIMTIGAALTWLLSLLPASTGRAVLSAPAPLAQAVISVGASCPALPVSLNSLSITPEAPAQQHVVNLTWTATAPTCFSLTGYRVKGQVKFSNGQTRTFAGTFGSNQQGAHIPVAGVALAQPQHVIAKVEATATDAINGTAFFPPTPTITGSCPMLVQVTGASMIELVPAPNRPGNDFHPKIRVQWQAGAPPCQRQTGAEISGELKFGGKTHDFKQTVSGTQTSVDIVMTSLAVGAGFTPNAITARVTVNGISTITGGASKELNVSK
jgi:hypothetical protein